VQVCEIPFDYFTVVNKYERNAGNTVHKTDMTPSLSCYDT